MDYFYFCPISSSIYIQWKLFSPSSWFLTQKGDKLFSSWCCGSRRSWDQSACERDLLTGSKFSHSRKECVTFISLPREEKPRVAWQRALICTRHRVYDLLLSFITNGVSAATTLRLVPWLTADIQSSVQAPAWLAAEPGKHVCWDYK